MAINEEIEFFKNRQNKPFVFVLPSLKYKTKKVKQSQENGHRILEVKHSKDFVLKCSSQYKFLEVTAADIGLHWELRRKQAQSLQPPCVQSIILLRLKKNKAPTPCFFSSSPPSWWEKPLRNRMASVSPRFSALPASPLFPCTHAPHPSTSLPLLPSGNLFSL